MAEDSWSLCLSASSNQCQSTLQSRSDLCIDFDEMDGDDDLRAEFPCPYCSDEFDIVELCCHIEDEHLHEANTGVCPVCELRVGMNMVVHITTEHGNIFKIQHRLDLLKGEYQSALSLKKELQDEHLKSLFGGSSRASSSPDMAPDPLLSLFFYNLPTTDESESVQRSSSTEAGLLEKSSDENMLERNIQPSPLSDKDQEEKAQRCEFVQGLLWSTIFDDR